MVNDGLHRGTRHVQDDRHADEADHCSHDIESIRLVPSVPQPHSNERVMNIPPEAAYVRPGRRPLR